VDGTHTLPAPARRGDRGGGGSLTLGHVRGVPIRVHWTLLLALPYLAFAFIAQLSRRGGGTPPAHAFLLGLVLAVGLFAGVALHELAHTLVGIRLGATVRSITLMFLGGVSELSRAPRGPGGEVVMAAAGPAASLAIAGVSWAIAQAFHGVAASALTVFAQVNLAIGVFNLVPAFPLDGGRVLRGALAGPLGPARATRVAATVGRAIAVALAILGILSFNFVLVLIALFIYLGASAESEATLIEERLGRVRVGDLYDPVIVTIDAAATLAQAAEAMAESRQWVLVVTSEGRVTGQLAVDRVRPVPPEARGTTRVSVAMKPTSAFTNPREAVTRALARMRDEGVDRLPVVDGEQLVGLLRRDDVLRLVELRPV
jgi:Zn-dependent protease